MKTDTAAQADSPVETLEDYAIGVVTAKSEYKNTRFLSGTLKDKSGAEHAIQVTRKGTNGDTRYDILLGLQRGAKVIGELIPVNGHLEGKVGDTLIGGVFLARGAIALIPAEHIKTKPAAEAVPMKDQLAAALAGTPASTTTVDANMPF